MKIHYQHLLRFIKEKLPIKDLSEFLFQLGHENEIENEILDIEFTLIEVIASHFWAWVGIWMAL